VLLRLFAPFLPFCTEEAWSWWHDDSVHTSPWPAPSAGDRPAAGGADAGIGVIAAAAAVISAIRKAKSEARQSMRAPVRTVRVHGPAAEVDVLRAAHGDIAAAGHVDTLLLEAGPETELSIDVDLADA